MLILKLHHIIVILEFLSNKWQFFYGSLFIFIHYWHHFKKKVWKWKKVSHYQGLQKTAARNSLNQTFGQESKSCYLNESFLLLNNMFRRNEKKKKTLPKTFSLFVLSQKTKIILIHFKSTFPLRIIWKSLKTSVLWYFRWLKRANS